MYNFYINNIENNRIYKKICKYIPLIILCLYILFIHKNISPLDRDDVYFGSQYGNLFNILINRYHTWTSRLLIESVSMSILTYARFLWKIIDCLMILLIYYSINKIFNSKNSLFIRMILVLLIIIYPFDNMNDAGWGNTTIVYLWTFALALFALIPITKELKNEKYNKKIWFLAIPSFIFSVNNEQICALYFGFLVVFNIYYYIINKKINKLLLILLLISITSLIFTFTCPGNSARLESNTRSWFKDYDTLTFFDKIKLSINNTYFIILGRVNYIFILLSILITYCIFKNTNSKLIKTMSIIFTIGSIVLTRIYIFRCNDLYIRYYSNNNLTDFLQLHSKSYYLSIFVSIIYTVFYTIQLYYIFKNNKNKYIKYLIPIMFLAGLMSKFIIGFSPVIFVSSIRTNIYMYFIFIMLIIYILDRLKTKKQILFNFTILTFIMFVFAKILLITVNFRFI